MLRGEIILTAAEFALFFEGANFEKRFIDSPSEIKKSFPMSQAAGDEVRLRTVQQELPSVSM
jgi:hypothetical protein